MASDSFLLDDYTPAPDSININIENCIFNNNSAYCKHHIVPLINTTLDGFFYLVFELETIQISGSIFNGNFGSAT